ncbi:MAG: hypothetical protein U0359_23705 [Byssovorax sp.]
MRAFTSVSPCVLALALMVLPACGSIIIIEGDPSSTTAGEGGGGGAIVPGSTTSSTTSAGGEQDPPPAPDCPTICEPVSDPTLCTCKRFCADPSFEKPDAKITCAKIGDGSTVQCVCTYSDDFSGVCFDKNDQTCSFDLGCCAKYFYGK